MPEQKQKQRKGTIFLHPNIWEELATLADANGIPLSEEARACLIEGLRIRQKRLIDSGYTPKADNAIALLKSLVTGEEPSAAEVSAIAKALDVSPHELQAKLDKEAHPHAVPTE